MPPRLHGFPRWPDHFLTLVPPDFGLLVIRLKNSKSILPHCFHALRIFYAPGKLPSKIELYQVKPPPPLGVSGVA